MIKFKMPTIDLTLIPDGYAIVEFRKPNGDESYIGCNSNNVLIIAHDKKYQIYSNGNFTGLNPEECFRYILKKIDVEPTYPVYLHSYKPAEWGTLAIKFDSKFVYTFYSSDGTTNRYDNGYFKIDQLIEQYGYTIISKEEFENFITPPKAKECTPVTLNNKVAVIDGLSYKLTLI